MNTRKLITVGLLAITSILTGIAQTPALKFNANKKFKIVQFTDLHICYQDPRSDIVYERVAEVLDAEKPDFVVLTGDVIFSPPADKGLKSILAVISGRKIPFALTFGNHDQEQGLDNKQLFSIIENTPYNVTKDEPGLSGTGNCAITIKASTGERDAAVLYCLDSHRQCDVKGVEGYGYIKSDQISWYKRRSAAFTEANNGQPLPSLCFFHVPLPEYAQAASSEGAQLYGTRREKVCSPALNSGMFTAIKECGDVMGIFTGHDHDNDYAVEWYGVLLAYGRYTGGNTVYNNLSNGARVIELEENDYSIKTWIRTAKGKTEQTTVFPRDYVKEK